MAARKDIVFLFNLLQDVNIQRGLVFLARRETGARLRFLISAGFLKRDRLNIWQAELAELAAETGAEMHVFGDMAQAHAVLQGRGGIIFAASESHLDAHHETRDTFRIAPPSFLKVTLQHGLECVGFLQSREHVMGHGRDIAFNADVVCGWLEPGRLTSLTVQSRGKLYVTGPPTLLQPAVRHPEHPPEAGGIVCENMHSVRLSASGNHRASFMDIFFDFCRSLDRRGKQVTLRPHPGGQYVLKHGVALPGNVTLNNLPIYHVNLPGYAYGISAPSTIVLDMVLAEIPVAVWRDPGGVMDADNYDGLTQISTLDDWRAFERDAEIRPGMLLARQRAFLDGLGIILDPEEIRRRFARLMVNGLAADGGRAGSGTVVSGRVATPATAPAARAAPVPASPLKVLFLSEEAAPGLRAAFLDPLALLVTKGEIETHQLTEAWHVTPDRQDPAPPGAAKTWVADRVASTEADLIVCTSGAGIFSRALTRAPRRPPVVLYADAMFLRRFDAAPDRADPSPVGTLLALADLVYAADARVAQALKDHPDRAEIVESQVIGGRRLLRPPMAGPPRRMVLIDPDARTLHALTWQLAGYLDRNTAVTLDVLGPPALPDALRRFGARVALLRRGKSIDPAGDLAELALDRNWDIGLVPGPRDTADLARAWRFLAAAGVPMLAGTPDRAVTARWQAVAPDGWAAALQGRTDRPAWRYEEALQAQTRMLILHSDARLRAEILSVLNRARQISVPEKSSVLRPVPATLATDGRILAGEDPS